MVDIIKPGKLESKRKILCTCRKCDCCFTFTAAEAQLMTDDRHGNYYEIVCPMPDCNSICTISER